MISLTVNGTAYSYPQAGDLAWENGTNGPTEWASAVTTGMLSKAGGLFSLTALANFGPNYGIKSIYVISGSANPAATGVIRLANADAIAFRNSGNSADLLLQPDADGILQYNAIDLVNLSATQTLTNKSLSGSSNTFSSIPYSSLVLTGDVVNADISTSAAIAYSKLNLSTSILNSDISASAAIAYSKLASLSTGQILLGNAGTPTATTLGGDATVGATGTLTIAASAVTLAKQANLAANSVIGNSTGSGATPTAVSMVSTATASAVMIRDSNANVAINNINEAFTTTVTAAGTTTLTVASNPLQQFTGTTTQICALPSASTLSTGCQYQVFNRSTGVVTVKDGGGNTLQAMAANSQCIFTCAANGSTAGTWDVSYAMILSATTLVRSGVVSLSSGVTSATITYSSALPNTSYSLNVTMLNTTDTNPQFQPLCVTAKSTTGCTVTFNAPTASSNYSMFFQAITNV